ncbi:ABC transporter substrate-binding protein [Bradyrhizobium liaoningense]|uniref:ABC transporter substrate-binding protein n=1 Tax=Bradyrhizobium liaoningense TaxID=43992 RepID=UPI001BA8BDBB|nr:ABC transporter substrate-binding protein [Bradyrhizobium liaoningense]MBR0719209.1 ABC transporter substrate-binding protein [Bradyrhizobium liaoningense]
MQRREFITLIGTIGAVWPRRLVAQPADQTRKKMPRIGFLASVPHERIDAFDRGLRDQGYVEGENIIIERRFWNNDPKQLARFAAELVALDVAVIVAPTTPEALAAKAVTGTIPIVTATADAVGVGLAASFARPDGNVTGLTAVGGSSKNLGLLAELLPRATRFAVLLDPDNRYHAQAMVGFQNAAAERHLEILPVVKRSVDDIGPAFQTMASKGVQGLLVLSDPIGAANRRKIIELAAQNRIPAVYYWREDAVEGGLLAYGADLVGLNRRSAAYVAKLLRGSKAADLPIEQAERFRLVINLKTANALGLSIPTALLAMADELIE